MLPPPSYPPSTPLATSLFSLGSPTRHLYFITSLPILSLIVTRFSTVPRLLSFSSSHFLVRPPAFFYLPSLRFRFLPFSSPPGVISPLIFPSFFLSSFLFASPLPLLSPPVSCSSIVIYSPSSSLFPVYLSPPFTSLRSPHLAPPPKGEGLARRGEEGEGKRAPQCQCCYLKLSRQSATNLPSPLPTLSPLP